MDKKNKKLQIDEINTQLIVIVISLCIKSFCNLYKSNFTEILGTIMTFFILFFCFMLIFCLRKKKFKNEYKKTKGEEN